MDPHTVYTSQRNVKEEEIVIDGVSFKEIEDRKTEIRDGKETTTLVLTGYVGDKVCATKTTVKNKAMTLVVEKITLPKDEIAAFKKCQNAIKMLKDEPTSKN